MNDTAISWCGTVSEQLEYNGPSEFSRERLERQEDLFGHRSALFYTPTERIPPEYVGSGPLDITLPVAPPDYTEFYEIRSYRIPRFWVDLIQRQTHKLRWNPISPAKVTFVRYDYYTIRTDHLSIGTKALLDALKVRTSGRRDGLYLHYFGAIVDDGPGFVNIRWSQDVVDHPRNACVRVIVETANKSLHPTS